MADRTEHERDSYVVRDNAGTGAGAWIFGIFIAALVALGIWYFAAGSGGSDTNVAIEGPAATTEAPAPAGADTAPAAPDAAPAAPDAAPAAPDAAPAAPEGGQ